MSEQNKTVLQHGTSEGFNKQNLDEFYVYFSPGLVNHVLWPGLPAGLEGTKTLASIFLAAYPDLQITLEDVVAEDDKVVARWSAWGTHQGDLVGIPPTGKEVTITGIVIDRFENGRTVERWENIAQLQLGVIPAPETN